MKKNFVLFLLFVLILMGCAPAATGTSISTTNAASTQTAMATEPPVVASPTLEPTQVPSLQVGMTHLYIDGVNLVAIPSGEFTMGGNEADNPGHPVTLNDYWIYSTKVTNQQYVWCVQLGICTLPDANDNPGYLDYQRTNDPVTGVTYDQAAAYCGFVHGRLPTEAEWEYAAHNPQGGKYPWGDTAPTCDQANFNNCTKGMTSVVKYANGASYFGALDMVGNAFEWVADWYDANYYQNSPAENPSGPENGTSRVVRSSGYDSSIDQLAITNRNSEDPKNHRSNLGFRCAVDQPDYFAPVCEAPMVYDNKDTASSNCPTLETVQVKNCAQNFPYTNVTVKGASNVKINAQGCVATDKPATVSCQPPNHRFSAQADCQVDISGQSICAAGYSLQGNTCIADGAQGACPAGLNFDTSKQCCGLPSGSNASSNALVCPVGTFYIASWNACLLEPVQELVTVSVDVEFKSCVASGGNGCKARTDCPFETIWSSDLCCCVYENQTNTCSIFQ